MPISISWDTDEKKIIRMEYSGRWTWEELYAATAQSHEMLNTVAYKVDFVHEWLRGAHIPSNVLVHAKNLIEKRHANVGIVVVVWSNALTKATWNIIDKVYASLVKQYTFILASSIEEARAKLQEAHAKEQLRES